MQLLNLFLEIHPSTVDTSRIKAVRHIYYPRIPSILHCRKGLSSSLSYFYEEMCEIDQFYGSALNHLIEFLMELIESQIDSASHFVRIHKLLLSIFAVTTHK